MKTIIYILLFIFSLSIYGQKSKKNSENSTKPKIDSTMSCFEYGIINAKDLSFSIIGEKVNEKFNPKVKQRFDRKIGFEATTNEGKIKGFYYLNTQNGTTWIPWESFKQFTENTEEGELDQILTHQLDFYNFMKSAEGKFWMKISGQNNMSMSNEEVKRFFKNSSYTGVNKQMGNNNSFTALEFKGKDEKGQTIYFYMACPLGLHINTKKTNAVMGFMGLGFLADDNQRTYMLVGFKNNKISVYMTYNEAVNVSFDPTSYKAFGHEMKDQILQNIDEFSDNFSGLENYKNEIKNESDPTIKNIKEMLYNDLETVAKEQIDQIINFTKSSDMNDMVKMNESNSQAYHQAYYNMLIKGSFIAFLELEKNINELKKNNGDTRIINDLKCQKECAKKQTLMYLDMRDEHLEALKIKNEDKRENKISEIIQRYSTSEPCKCN